VPKRSLPIVTRREVLRWVGVATASTLPPLVGCSSASSPRGVMLVPHPKATPYFTSDEVSVLNALADAVLPPDDVVGGSSLGIVHYIENLLTAFEQSPPLIYAGGPYSGRTAMPTSHGDPSSTFPPDEFANFLPLDRFQTTAWKLRIYGSAGVSGGGPNDEIAGPVIGLRDSVAKAISLAKAAMPPNVAVEKLSVDEKTTMLRSLDSVTQNALIELVIEGAFAPPEYGGNTDQMGWKMMYFEGDCQPLGYSWFNVATNSYTEDPAHPVSTANPGADPMPLDAKTEQTMATVITLLGGKVFP
jgi:hypothetical protein